MLMFLKYHGLIWHPHNITAAGEIAKAHLAACSKGKKFNTLLEAHSWCKDARSHSRNGMLLTWTLQQFDAMSKGFVTALEHKCV